MWRTAPPFCLFLSAHGGEVNTAVLVWGSPTMWHMPRSAAVVSVDLVMSSRATAALDALKIPRCSPDALSPGDLAVIDLNSAVSAGLERIARLHEASPGVIVIAYCAHEDKELRVAAKAAGATQVVTNRHLGEALERWCRDK